MVFSRCRRNIDHDHTNFIFTEEMDKPVPRCSDDRLCSEYVPTGRMAKVVKSNNHNFDKAIVVKWSSKEDGRVVDMFCNVLKEKLKEVYV